MMEKENARPVVGATEQATMNMGEQTTYSIDDLITENRTTQGKIEAMLHTGEENALRTSFLSAITGLSPRELRLEIARERENGALILSTCRGEGGYFLPAEGEQGQRELERFVATLQARAVNTLKALKTAREAAQRLEGQISIDDIEPKGGK